jgi:hypothetical protein
VAAEKLSVAAFWELARTFRQYLTNHDDVAFAVASEVGPGFSPDIFGQARCGL